MENMKNSKQNKQLALRIDDELNKKIDDCLESLPRKTYPTKSELIREAIEAGLIQILSTQQNEIKSHSSTGDEK